MDDSSRKNSVEAYDPLTSTWSTAPALATARNSLAATTGADGRIYVIGGVTSSLTNVVDVDVLG
jgi:hypothetical protein